MESQPRSTEDELEARAVILNWVSVAQDMARSSLGELLHWLGMNLMKGR